jgi:hypothetical protein
MGRQPRIYSRVLAPPAGSFFLFGARGTGKSTWLRKMFPEAHRVVCRGDRRQRTSDGVDILPVSAWLAELEGLTLFPAS